MTDTADTGATNPVATNPVAMDPAEELAILCPDADITVTDPDTGEPVTLTVREYRFREGLTVQATARALIEDLAALAGESDAMTPARVCEVLGRHGDLWIDLCALSTGRDGGWIASLREPDAGQLSMAVWSVNSGFFTARILGQHLGVDAMRTHWASLMSSTSSPHPDTDGPTR